MNNFIREGPGFVLVKTGQYVKRIFVNTNTWIDIFKHSINNFAEFYLIALATQMILIIN